MAVIRAKSNVVFERNRFGQFARECEDAANRTVERTVELGARTSRAMAPVGGERKSNYSRRPGYIPLRASIGSVSNGHSGYWYTTAPHWKFVEYNTGAHPITGFLKFTWKGGLFRWNDPRYHNWNEEEGATVNHPGTGAQPFMKPAYQIVVKRQMMKIAKEEFPG